MFKNNKNTCQEIVDPLGGKFRKCGLPTPCIHDGHRASYYQNKVKEIIDLFTWATSSQVEDFKRILGIKQKNKTN